MSNEKESHGLPLDEGAIAGRQATLIHATLIKVNHKGVLLKGPSGAGKSDLALRLISIHYANTLTEHPPALIADDQVIIEKSENSLIGRAPETLKDQMEVRHLGIVPMPAEEQATIGLLVKLQPNRPIPRMPVKEDDQTSILGLNVPTITLNPFEASAPIKIILATRADAT
jgi:serine kinase of HPr protein (carbohydrate metabolism regulator)